MTKAALAEILRLTQEHQKEWQEFKERAEPLLLRAEAMLRIRMPWKK